MTGMMKRKMKSKDVASVEELRDLCIEANVKPIACQMTVDLFDFKKDDLIDRIKSGEAATFSSLPAKPTSLCQSDCPINRSVGQNTRLTTESITTRNSTVMMLPARMKSAVL